MAANNSNNQTVERDNFTSQLGVVLAAAGSAIGIGNVWRFSYIVGVNGGGAFLLVYLICVIMVGLPLIMAEITIGRSTGRSAVTAFKKIAPGSLWWIAGATGVLAAFLIMTYYPLIAAWSLGYMFESVFSWNEMVSNTEAFYNAYVSGIGKPMAMMAAILIVTAFTLVGGVAEGIEKWNKVLMPALVGIIIVLIIRALTLSGSIEGVKFLFYPDFSKLSVSSFLDALGHGFYSLSVGMGIMITYGSYVRKEDDIVSTSVSVLTLDTVTALMSGIAIFPAVFALGLQPDSGPGLAFITLPKAFSTLPGGQVFAALFFLLLTISALSSMMSMLQVLVAYLEDEFHVKKKTALIVLTVILYVLGILSVLSFSTMADVKFFGLTYFDFVDRFSANIIVPITGLLTALFVIFRYGTINSQKELLEGSKKPNGIMMRCYPFLIKFVVPVSVILILLYATGFFSIK